MEILNSLSAQVNTQNAGNIASNQPERLAQQEGLFKNQPTQQNATNQRSQEALDNLDKLVGRVLEELKSTGSTTKAEQILQQAKDTQISPNLSKDLQSLVKMLETQDENDGVLKGFALKLKEFLKPIADIKTGSFNEQIKNSGIMLEANLKEALNGQKLPSSMLNLLNDIKNLSNKELLANILSLAADENLDNHGSFIKLNQMLQASKNDAAAVLNNSLFKNLLSDVSKLDNIAKFLNKESKEDLSGDKIRSQAAKINEFVDVLKSKVLTLANEKLSQNSAFDSNFKSLKSALEDIKNTLKALNSIGDEAGVIKFFNNITSSLEEATLQDKLTSAARRLAQTINIADREASSAKANLNEVKSLIKQLNLASNDISKIEPKNAQEIAKTLSSDVKSTLLSIQDKTQNQQINQAVNKMLSQIEMHQMVSSIGGGIQTYMPYVWDGVDGANVAFKRGKKDKYYAQIDLNFKKFGQINIMVGLIDKRYIDISIATQSAEFKSVILENSAELKQAISEVGLIISNFNLRVLDKKQIKQKFKDFGGLEVGYDKKA
ncbi:hypothetical protein CCAL9344_05200 [Campylobacter sp. RM9344]|uniref:Flagellar hook-length control protein-like C-terminal domain-containing protein n=1 Tax=Campylobacter californiensis TaxID=1032243 RepID=A0AAW3ZYE7_9BACT|nr:MULTISPECIES: hypothetical protein [unclassified Campylobacter]MBE2984826.1 hypothetical protein [Campylobacter sp. RM6883]MBE2986530.1 hypothetical protein [Campylobacter sp. RM12919]MBE2987730.1 hypothetical protein [Campylobacter sp. RM12920]MBE2994708.1 hypothetical protein [Campylobacter sp. RM6913]MBE3029574.1 hypothetical protein [Campylobacter sp. RM9344]